MKPQIHSSPGSSTAQICALLPVLSTPSQEFCSHLIPPCFLLLFIYGSLLHSPIKGTWLKNWEKNPTKILHPQIILLGFFGFPSSRKMLDAILFTVRWSLVSSVELLLKRTLGLLVLQWTHHKAEELPLDSLAGLVSLMLI